MSDDVVVIGGIGGTAARLEDLTRISEILETATDYLLGVGTSARVFRHILADLRPTPEHGQAQALAVERVGWVDAGPGGATAAAWEIADIASDLRQTVELLEYAEHRASSVFDTLGRAWDKVVSLVEIGVWIPLKTVGATVGTVADIAGMGPQGWGPNGWIANGIGDIADFINPDWTPNAGPLVYGDDIQALLQWGDDAIRPALVVPRWLARQVGLEAPDGLVELIGADLAQLTLALDNLLGDPRGLVVAPVASRITVPPSSVADLLSRVSRLSPEGADGPGRIAIERIEHSDGTRAWIVEIPGTQDWTPNGSWNVFDLTSDCELLATGVSDSSLAVEEAMRQAGIPPGDPVMMVGHSQGGMVALSLASDPDFASRFNVTAAVTAGSPVGRFDPPARTEVLSLEHPSDTVVALDAADNPDRPSWVTVRHDLGKSSDPLLRAADDQIVGRHELASYVPTAALVDTSGDSSIRAWRGDASPFFTDQGSTSVRTVYEAIRGNDRPTVPLVSVSPRTTS